MDATQVDIFPTQTHNLAITIKLNVPRVVHMPLPLTWPFQFMVAMACFWWKVELHCPQVLWAHEKGLVQQVFYSWVEVGIRLCFRQLWNVGSLSVFIYQMCHSLFSQGTQAGIHGFIPFSLSTNLAIHVLDWKIMICSKLHSKHEWAEIWTYMPLVQGWLLHHTLAVDG